MGFPTSVQTFTTKNPGDTIPSADWNTITGEITAIESGVINGTAPINSSALTVNGAATLSTGFTERGRSVAAGEWSTFATTFAASTGTWQAAPLTMGYTLLGHTLIWAFVLNNSTLTDANTLITMSLPSTFVATVQHVIPVRLNNGGSDTLAFAFVTAGSTALSVSRASGAFSSGLLTLQGIVTLQING